MTPAEPPKRRRWFRRLLGVFAVALVAAVAGLPRLASTERARPWLLKAVNRLIAPTQVEASAVRLSWTAPAQVRGLVIRNAAGKVLVRGSRATLDRGLWPLLTGQATRAKLTLENAAFDVARSGDGSLDLADAFRRPLERDGEAAAESRAGRGKAGLDLTIAVTNGTLKFASPELLQPLQGHRVSATIHLPSTFGPATWHVTMFASKADDRARLEVAGEFDRGPQVAGVSDLKTSVSGKAWPFALTADGTNARGRLDGRVDVSRKQRAWTVTADANVLDLDVAGRALAGDRLRLDRVKIAGHAVQTFAFWDIGRLELDCAVGAVKVAETVINEPTGASVPATRVEARIDLAALGRQVPRFMQLRRGLVLDKGTARIDLTVAKETGTEGRRIVLEALVSRLAAHDERGPVELREATTISAEALQGDDQIKVDRFAARGVGGRADASGDLDRGISLTGMLDLAEVQESYGRVFNFRGVELGGRARFVGDYRRAGDRAYVGRVACELSDPQPRKLPGSPFLREPLRIDAAVSGPLGTGLPAAWTHCRVGLKTAGMLLETKMSMNAADPSIRIDEIRLGWQPKAVAVAGSSAPRLGKAFHLVAHGRYEPASGTLELRALPDAVADPFMLEGDGIKLTGLDGDGAIRGTLSARGDLAGIEEFCTTALGGRPVGLKGALSVRASLAADRNGRIALAGKLQTDNATLPGSRPAHPRALVPLSLDVRAGVPAGGGRVNVDTFTLTSRYGTVQAVGLLTQVPTGVAADVRGVVTANWKAIDPFVARAVEPGAFIHAQSLAFSARGPIAGSDLATILSGLQGGVTIQKAEAAGWGVKVSPATIAAHIQNGVVTIDPIETAVNGGRATLRPGLQFDAGGTATVTLAPGSSVDGAELNDKVARSLLSYAAPVFEKANGVTGRVSIQVDHAEVPLAVPALYTRTAVTGRMAFSEVQCSAGPLAAEIFRVTGRPARAFRLDQSLEVTVAKGRVHQRGLAVPLGPEARIDLEGSVGFDKTLALRARLIANRGLARGRDDLNALIETLRLGVPIGGTLSKPAIDRRVLEVGLRDLGTKLLKRSGNREAAEMLRQLVRPDNGDPRNGADRGGLR